MPKLKDFEVIMPSFACNRDCPYCTAKITKWKERNFEIDKLGQAFKTLREKNYHFKYFILCGNGEPSLYDLSTYSKIWQLVSEYRDLFDNLRAQTSGQLFFEPEKLDILPKDTIIEITRVSYDTAKDMTVLKHSKEYLDEMNNYDFNIRLNIAVLKGMTAQQLIDDIKQYKKRIKHLAYVSIKTLNLNTLSDDHSDKHSQWIINNAVSRNQSDSILKEMQAILQNGIVEYSDRVVWQFENLAISLYQAKGKQYGDTHMVFYGDELVDFKLNSIQL